MDIKGKLNLIIGKNTTPSFSVSGEEISEAILNNISPGDIEFVTDALSLRKGIYLLSLEHNAEHDGARLYLTSENAPFGSLLADEIVFNIDVKNHKMYFWLKDDADDLRIHINYGDQSDMGGALEIISMDLFRSRKTHVAVFITLFFFISLFDAAVIFLYRTRNSDVMQRIIPIALILIALISSMNSLGPDIPGHTGDMDFHLYRIEAIAEGLRNGILPVKIAPGWMNGYGYAVGVFYGQLFLYIPAVLRLCGFDVVSSLRVFIIFINLLSAVCAYYGFRVISKDRLTALVSAAAYNFASYRLANLYVRGAVGEFEAAAFLPLIMAGLHGILTEKTDDQKFGSYSIIAAFGYTGLIHTHILSCEMAGFFTIVLCLLCVKRVFEKKRFIELCKTVLYTIAINAGFIIPFFDFYRDKFFVNDGSRTLNKIQYSGATLREIFAAFFYVPTGRLYAFTGLLLTLTFFACGILLFCRAFKTGRNSFTGCGTVFVMSLLSVWMSSHHFPYDRLMELPVLNSLVVAIQFPTRFVSITSALWSFLFCILIMEFCNFFKDQKNLCHVCAVLLAFVAVLGAMDFENNMLSYDFYEEIPHDTAGMNSFSQMNGEFIPSGTDWAYLKYVYVYNLDGNVYVQDYQINESELNFIALNGSANDGLVTVPRLFYRGYVARDMNTGEYLQVTKDLNNSVQVVIPAGYTGRVSVFYREFRYWRVAELISVLSLLGILFYSLKGRLK